MLVTAPVEQFLTGFQLAETQCSFCKITLQEGDAVSAYAVRYARDDAWDVPRLYCHTCRATIEKPTLGATELLAEGRLGLTMDAATQRTSLTLLGIEQITRSAPEDGHVTL